jgi:hypothetical protein
MAETEKLRVLVEIDRSDLVAIFGVEEVDSPAFAGYLDSALTRAIKDRLPVPSLVLNYVDAAGRCGGLRLGDIGALHVELDDKTRNVLAGVQ